jgi:hypothetical protein
MWGNTTSARLWTGDYVVRTDGLAKPKIREALPLFTWADEFPLRSRMSEIRSVAGVKSLCHEGSS